MLHQRKQTFQAAKSSKNQALRLAPMSATMTVTTQKLETRAKPVLTSILSVLDVLRPTCPSKLHLVHSVTKDGQPSEATASSATKVAQLVATEVAVASVALLVVPHAWRPPSAPFVLMESSQLPMALSARPAENI
jgi:hypothetical protein